MRQKRSYTFDNHDGWSLEIRHVIDRDHLDSTRRPLLIVPGYGMNTFIFGFHPEGLSLEDYLARSGFEVWAVNLRGQGEARRVGGQPGVLAGDHFGFAELALVDLPATLDFVLETTQTSATSVDLVGCSLGGSLVYAFLAHNPNDTRAGAIVSIGGPLRWDTVHPLVKLVFGSRRIAGAVPVVGTRRLARAALPVVRHVPPLLSFYMNARSIDLTRANDLVQTVENPRRSLNKQIAAWIRDRDLIVRGLNVPDAMRDVDRPLLCILANRDGVVTPESALSVTRYIGSDDVEVLRVGTQQRWYAHADLFVSRHAQTEVFAPLVDWLERHESSPWTRSEPSG